MSVFVLCGMHVLCRPVLAQETPAAPTSPEAAPTAPGAPAQVTPPPAFDADSFIVDRKPETPLKVNKVMGGNLILLETGETVRLIGVDIPEEYAERAYGFLKQLVEGEEVRLEFERRNRDVEGHLLATVFKGDVSVNKLLMDEAAHFKETEHPYSYTPEFLDSVFPKRTAPHDPWEFILGEKKLPPKIARITLKNKTTLEGELLKETPTHLIIKRKFKGMELVNKKDIKDLTFK